MFSVLENVACTVHFIVGRSLCKLSDADERTFVLNTVLTFRSMYDLGNAACSINGMLKKIPLNMSAFIHHAFIGHA